MLREILEIEYKLCDLESSPHNLSNSEFIDLLIELRQRAFSHWQEENPESVTSDATTDLRDRITRIEQRLLSLATDAPADSINDIKSKLKLWMLFKDLPGTDWPSADVSDDLIVSVYMDLSRTVTGTSNTEVNGKPNLRWVS